MNEEDNRLLSQYGSLGLDPLGRNSEQIEGNLFCPEIYPLPLRLFWRLVHCCAYVFGGLTFLLGSMCYFPNISSYETGGWLFTWGSAAFLFADLLEWCTNNRMGCLNVGASKTALSDFEAALDPPVKDLNTYGGIWQRAENGLNFFLSVCGSFLYLWGSVYFIPALDKIVEGTVIFIVGSAVIFTSQAWKLSRYPNYTDDAVGVHVDAGAGIGGLAYLVGSVCFLPAYCVTDADTTRAATIFTLGGVLFLYSGLAIMYRYFFDDPPKY